MAGNWDAAYRPDYTEQVERSRSWSYNNRQEEDQLVNDFDHNMTQALRTIEGHAVTQLVTFNEGAKQVVSEAKSIQSELRTMELDLRDGNDVDLERWSALDNRARQIAAKVERLPDQFAGHHERLTDVLAFATELQKKYPALHRPYLLPFV